MISTFFFCGYITRIIAETHLSVCVRVKSYIGLRKMGLLAKSMAINTPRKTIATRWCLP